MNSVPVDLVLLAGGQASRLQGRNKGLLMREGLTQLERWCVHFAGQVQNIYLSSRVGLAWPSLPPGVTLVQDDAKAPLAGPQRGLYSAAMHSQAVQVLSLPIDVVRLPERLLPQLSAALTGGIRVARLQDADGLQPLIALWEREFLLRRLAQAGADASIQGLQRESCATVAISDFECGNLNSMKDLQAYHVR